MVGNPLAYLMLVIWPVVVVILFKRLPQDRALIWSLLGGYLFLPPRVFLDVPVVALDKTLIPSMAATACLMAQGARPLAMPRSWLLRVLIVLYVISPFLTSAANPEALVEGVSFRPPYSAYDAFGSSLLNALMVLPFLLAHNVLSGERGTQTWLRALMTGGLIYTIPMLIEVRLSPQINVWVYGFFAHDFIQMIRYGGFRPMVFLVHGLWVALFAFTALAAAAGLARDSGYPTRMVLAVVWIALVLVMCKSAASLLYALMILPLALLASPAMKLRVAALLTTLVLAYPLAHATGIIPIEAIGGFLMGIDADRAGSMIYRFANESVLVEHWLQKPLAGWGGWGRHLLVDPGDGSYITVSDGRWIVLLGTGGLFAFAAEFGLFALPVLAAWRCREARGDHLLSLTVLIHATTLVDLIPNATNTPLTLLTAGLIVAQVERLRAPGGKAAFLPGRPGRPHGFVPLPGTTLAGPAFSIAAPAGRAPAIRTLL